MQKRQKPKDGKLPSDNQLVQYAENHKNQHPPHGTTSAGNPYLNVSDSLTVGPRGPTLLEDAELLDYLAHFNRERIPERVVHSHGGGAFGVFEVTDDITQYSAASVFSAIGKKTNIVVRFSLVMADVGSADTVRDIRGFAIKFYTDEGIWDLAGNNLPVFFVRDAARFPDFVHSQKRNPVTNIMHDWDMYWDFLSLSPESLHIILILFSDRGIPNGFRFMHGYGVNTFKLINSKHEAVYCRFNYLSDQGIKNLTQEEGTLIAGKDPDYSVRDLYDAIAKGEYPSWTLYIQVMTFQQATEAPFNPFDATLAWPKKDYPLIKVGKFTLNRNCSNYFAEIEQLCFSPASMPPGIGPSPDRLLQGRLFAYDDTQKYRVGVNALQLPVNRPFKVHNNERDGCMVLDNQGGTPNYYPNSFGGPTPTNPKALFVPQKYNGDVNIYPNQTIDNYRQPKAFYENVLDDPGRERLANNIVSSLKLANESIQTRMVNELSNVNQNLGKRVRQGLTQSNASNAGGVQI